MAMKPHSAEEIVNKLRQAEVELGKDSSVASVRKLLRVFANRTESLARGGIAMPLDLERFVKLRPTLYHLTAASNAAHIRSSGRIDSAAALYRSAGIEPSIRCRRASEEWIRCDGDDVHIRDQAPLHRGNIDLSDGWRFEDLVAYLNEHVFFWPGKPEGPIPHGLRHFKRYAREKAVVLSFDTQELFAANADPGPRFCKYNSGSPRCTGGQRSPRGPGTFLRPSAFPHRAGEVIEVTFPASVDLHRCSIIERPVRDLVHD